MRLKKKDRMDRICQISAQHYIPHQLSVVHSIHDHDTGCDTCDMTRVLVSLPSATCQHVPRAGVVI